MRLGWTIFRYLISSVVPYFVFSWLLLSVVLFVQQASRFSDIFFSANIPSALIWQLSLALIPNVIAFTCPMAALVGVIIGLNKLQADSELVAMRAAGVGNLSIALPMIVLGVLLSLFAFSINLKGVPFAAGIVRQVALQTALYKLESPIEPGVFNTEVAGFTIYVKEGDLQSGTWKNIFIFNEDESTGTVRLITSGRGRIDYSNENSELVLENALSTTLTGREGAEKYFAERIGEVRYAVKTRRSEVVDRLRSAELTPEELGLQQLSDYARARDGSERVEAELLWQRRLLLSATPLIFCIFGAALVLRYNQKSRGAAILTALVSLVVYYLMAFLGEQLARTGRLSVAGAGLVPIVGSVAAIILVLLTGRRNAASKSKRRAILQPLVSRLRSIGFRSWNAFADVTAGLRDLDVIWDLIRFYFLSLGFLGAIFLIFTAFELWKFAGTTENGISLLFRYLFYLAPFIYLQLAPSSAMLATLATYVLKSRQNEIITWTSAGQSVYRLLFPCVIFMAVLGLANWQIQERVMPRANQIQDELRTILRNRGAASKRQTRQWVATDGRIYSFDLSTAASDNVQAPLLCPSICSVKNLALYEFSADKTRLQSVYRGSEAVWDDGRIVFNGEVTHLELADGTIKSTKLQGSTIAQNTNPFGEIRNKPSHLDSKETREQMRVIDSDVEHRNFAVALEKKHTTPFLPFVIALFTAPFALSLSRKGKAATTGYAVGLWLLYMGVTSVFEQMGLNGVLPPGAAVWAPLIIFSLLGVFLLSRTRT